MKELTLATVADWTEGALIQGTPADRVNSICTDTRTLREGDLFVALKGERFDGHRFVQEAAEKGAAAMVLSELPADTEGFRGALIHVRDTLEALQRLAFRHRRDSLDLFAVGVTGSNGKTSTKDFLGAVLAAAGPVNRTRGNLNNHIGLPLTILSGDGRERYGVWEMGMNHPGEIEVLAEIAAPDAAVVTNIGTAHIEHLGSREAIAAEKGELAFAVPERGFCAMPEDDEFFPWIRERASCDMIGVGIGAGEVQAREVAPDEEGRMGFLLCSGAGAPRRVRLRARGRHMVRNALLAAAAGLRLGLESEAVAEALSGAELTGSRLQERRAGGFTFLDDSYNANPDSMQAALEALGEARVSGRRVAVLGFMGELGEHSEREHLRLGERVAAGQADALVTVGEPAALINRAAAELEVNRSFATHEEAAEFLREFLAPDDLVLVKGSRAAAMERVIELLD